MKSWVDGLTPPTESSIKMAKELDAYDIPEQFDLAKEVEKESGRTEVSEKETGPEEKSAEEAASRTGRFDSFKLWVLRSIAIFTSLSCAATSVYFSNIWFRDSQPPVIAIVMSLSVVLTLTAAPEFAISLARKKRWLTAVAIVLISVMATLFSMSSTIGGIYNARSVAIGAEYKSLVDGDSMAAAAEVDLLKAKIERLSRSMETDQGAVGSYQATIDTALAGGMDPGSREMQLFVANRNSAVARVRTGEQSIAAAERRIAELLARSVGVHARAGEEVRLDFAAWLGDRLGMSADQTEFLLAVFPAVFIDLISPAMLVVAFAL